MKSDKGDSENKLVSIVIPVYNVEEYLKECVESVLCQTYKNLEIILIDDGSTDGSGKLCNFYREIDNRIKVIHKENGGLSDARNKGIEVATGSYLYFLDSDDLIPQNAIAVLVTIARETECDVVMAGLQQFEGYIDKCFLDKKGVEVVTNEEAMKRMFLHEGIGHEACGKLYKSSLWLNMKFPIGKLYEDYACIYNIVASCKMVSIMHQNLYYYRIRQGSIMNTIIKERELQILDVSNQVTKYISEYVPNLKEYAEYLQLVTYLKTMKRIMDVGYNKYISDQKRIISFVNEHKYLINMKWCKKVDRIKVNSLMFGKLPFYIVYSLGEFINKKRLED